MTLGEDLCRKYALTSLKPNGGSFPLMAINEALEASAQMADREQASDLAARIRSLKWTSTELASAQDAA
jgi:hypothetical protein